MPLDVRSAWRALVAAPAVTGVIVLTIAVAIGANTALFSVVYGVLWRPLPFPESHRLMRVQASHPREGLLPAVSLEDFNDFARGQQAFDQFVTVVYWTFTMTGREMPARLIGVRASGDLFEMLRVPPLLGRTFSPLDDRPGHEQVVVLAYGAWRREFGGDSGVVGRTVTLNGVANTIIGVMPPGFAFPAAHTSGRGEPVEVWAPIGGEMTGVPRNSRFMEAYGRLREGVTPAQSEAELQGIARGLELRYPDSNAGWSVHVTPAREVITASSRPVLLMLLAAVTIVLLVASANVASLLMARASARSREIAIRLALGVSATRLLRQFMVEAVLVAGAGGVLGVALARHALSIVHQLAPTAIPRLEAVRLDAPVLSFSLGVTAAVTLVFGLLPARHVARLALSEILRGSESGAGRGTLSGRHVLVGAQVAMTVPLLIGSGLLVRSFIHVLEVDPGFQPDRLVAMDVFLTGSRFRTIESQRQYVIDGLTRIGSRADVASVAAISQLPLSGQSTRLPFRIDGIDTPQGEDRQTNYRAASATYFETMGMTVREGRGLSALDTATSEPVAVINETMARRYWPGRSAVGARIEWTTVGPQQWVLVVGVVSDVKAVSLERPDDPAAYIPIEQRRVPFMRWMTFVARVRGNPDAAAASVRAALVDMDRDQPVYGITTMNTAMAGAVAGRRFTMLLLTAFGAIAVTLAAVGVYATLSYTISRRTREIGIRMALGARRVDILRLVAGEGAAMVLVGFGAGLVTSIALTRPLQSLVFGVGRADPITLIATTGILLGVGMIAALVPARRAAAVDPSRTMRSS